MADSRHNRSRLFSWLVAVGCVGMVVGCSPPDRIELTDPEYLSAVTGDPLSLPGRVELASLDATIAYPDGWATESVGPLTTIARDPREITRWFAGDSMEGPLVFFEVETFEFMTGMGLEESDPTPDDLLEFSERTFGWTELRDETTVSLFEGVGIQVRGRDPRGDFLGIVGVLTGERSILIMSIAPTSDELDDLLPTWRAMAQSIEPLGVEEAALVRPHA